MNEKTRTLTATTTSRKFVPQRGWRVEWARAPATVSGSPCSYAETTMCSAPWYSKTRRISDQRAISAR